MLPLQITQMAKILVTRNTFELLLAIMDCLNVPVPIFYIGKCFLAKIAGNFNIFMMSSNMVFKLDLSCKEFVTSVALKVSLIFVNCLYVSI